MKHTTCDTLLNRIGLAGNSDLIVQQAEQKWKAAKETFPELLAIPRPAKGIYRLLPRSKEKDRISPELASASRYPARGGPEWYVGSPPSLRNGDLSRESHHRMATHVGLNQVYYISDIHLEHQLCLHENPSWEYLYAETDRLVSDMVNTALWGRGETSVLLVAGDVAASPAIASVFYNRLYAHWPGIVLSVLGNRELWNGCHWSGGEDRPLEELVMQYRAVMEPAENLKTCTQQDALFYTTRHSLLDNGIYFCYDGNWAGGLRYMDWDTAMSASKEELSALCTHCNLLVLGGTGFSGNLPDSVVRPNLYRSMVPDRQEDIRLSRRFFFLHERLRECAGNRRVIVLTHFPPQFWGPEELPSRWVYICGHGHQNSVEQTCEGSICFRDNQVGYEPGPWALKSIAY